LPAAVCKNSDARHGENLYNGDVKKNIAWPVLFLLVLALSRWPGLLPANFSAVYAMVFCAGLYVPGVAGWIIPLAVLAVTDLILSVVFYPQYFTWKNFLLDQSPNYIAYAGLIALGRSVGSKRPWWLLLGGGIVGAVLFYLITNTASWIILPYAKTLAGWIQALTAGLPGHAQTWEFFRNTLSSGGLFTGLFVGAMKLTEAEEPEPAEEEEKETRSVEDEREPADAET
jgi:hypothetical protein